MGRRIFSSLLAMALIFSLPVFSLADGGEVILKDSGSPEVSLMALRSIAADDGISLAAAEGDSGQFGYNIEPFNPYYSTQLSGTGTQFQVLLYDSNHTFSSPVYLSEGRYSLTFELNFSPSNAGLFYKGASYPSNSISYDGSKVYIDFTVDSSLTSNLLVYFNGASSSSILLDLESFELFPVEGISSGYTYSSGILDRSTRSIFSSFDADFGSQPAGKYLVNIYHWGDSYDVRFQISDSTESYYLPTSTNGSVTTLVYNHPGGQFTLDGSFTASNDETSVVDGSLSGAGMGDYFQLLGELGADGPLSWVFNIKDIVAIPYDQAADHNFGFFAPIIGFINNHFSGLKSFLADKFDKDEEAYTGATSPELSQDINSASSMIDQEQQFMEDINTQITDQSSKVDPVTVLDGIEGSSSVFSSMLWVSSIVSSGIDSMGIFQFLIYVPMILGVLTLVIGRGASLAGRRPRPQPVNVRKGK